MHTHTLHVLVNVSQNHSDHHRTDRRDKPLTITAPQFAEHFKIKANTTWNTFMWESTNGGLTPWEQTFLSSPGFIFLISFRGACPCCVFLSEKRWRVTGERCSQTLEWWGEEKKKSKSVQVDFPARWARHAALWRVLNRGPSCSSHSPNLGG